MNHNPRTYAALMACVFLSATQFAMAEDKTSSVVEDKIRTMVPNAKTIAISETPIEGIMQVQINSDIVYVSSDGQYLIQGQIMDIDTRVNITDQAKSGIRQGLLSDLNADEQITFAPEKAKYSPILIVATVVSSTTRLKATTKKVSPFTTWHFHVPVLVRNPMTSLSLCGVPTIRSQP